jgi:hypothetical protein
MLPLREFRHMRATRARAWPCDSAHLVCRQPSNHLRHLRISVDPEALVLGHTCQLHVLAVQLLLHDLLQRLEHENFGLGQSERFVELVLQFCLRTLGARSNGFGVVTVESAGRFCVVPIRALDAARRFGSY